MCFYVFCLIPLSWSLCPKSQKSQQNLQNHPRRKQRVQKQRKTPPANTSLICLTYAAKFAQVNLDTRCNQASEHFSQGFCFQCFFFVHQGRMVAPAEEAPTKVVKVATTVVRRQSTKTEETKTSTPPAEEDEVPLNVLEESLKNAQTSYETKYLIEWFLVSWFILFIYCFVLTCCVVIFHHRSEHVAGRDEEASFLSNLTSLWRGFIHMHNVAKLVTKAFPVSGILDNLTQVSWKHMQYTLKGWLIQCVVH